MLVDTGSSMRRKGERSWSGSRTIMGKIQGENMRRVRWVVVEEVKSGHWAIGGQPLATADLQALAAGGARRLTSKIRASSRTPVGLNHELGRADGPFRALG